MKETNNTDQQISSILERTRPKASSITYNFLRRELSDQVTDTSIEYTILALHYLNELNYGNPGLIQGSYVYGSTARGCAHINKPTILEQQVVINNEFKGSFFSKDIRNSDLDIEIITQNPQEAMPIFKQTLTEFINSSTNCPWAIRVSSMQDIYSNIRDTSKPSLYRAVFSSPIISITGHNIVQEVKELCLGESFEMDKEGYEQKKYLHSQIMKQMAKSEEVNVYVPSDLYSSIAPIYYVSWMPFGDKLQRGQIPKIRIPSRQHFDSILHIDQTSFNQLVSKSTQLSV